jgi:adenylosuccinate lyase
MIERYADEEMESIWSDENKIACWIQIELAALAAKMTEEIIPNLETPIIQILFKDCSTTEIEGNSSTIIQIKMLDFIEKWKEEEKKTHHDVTAFVHVLEETIGMECGRFLHYGITSSDLCDTEFSLRIRQALTLIKNEIRENKKRLYKLIVEHCHTVVMGRTHGMYAEPMSLGLVFGLYLSELDRHLERIRDAEKRLWVGKISGSVGTYPHINQNVEARVLHSLQLHVPAISNQIIQRDRHAELFCMLANIGGTLEKLALQIRGYSRSDVGEMAEAFGKQQKGSSSMPHKRNPILSENICGMSRLLRGYAVTAMENNALWHERDISHSSTERFIAPDAFGVLLLMLKRMNKVLRGLKVNRKVMFERVKDNVQDWSAQRRMLHLIKEHSMPRKAAHDIVQSGEDFVQLFTPETIDYYMRHTDTIISRILSECYSENDNSGTKDLP